MKHWTDHFLLRHLAGRYFIIKKAQAYPDYRRPIETDENGALFWRLLCRYPDDADGAAADLAKRCDISKENARADLEEFRQKILKHMGSVEYEEKDENITDWRIREPDQSADCQAE